MDMRSVLLTLVLATPAARADKVALPGDCVAPSPPPNADGTAATENLQDASVDLDGDGTKDVFVRGSECDGRMNCTYNVYVMRGSCGHLVGFGPDDAYSGGFEALPATHAGLHDLETHVLGMHEFVTDRLVFDGHRYSVAEETSSPRGGDQQDKDAARANAAADYKAAMAKARKLEDAGDHKGAVASFQDALNAGSADNITIPTEDEAEAYLELGASALAAGDSTLAESSTRQGLFEFHVSDEAAHAKVMAMGWYNLGNIAAAQGNDATATDAFQQSIRLNATKAAKKGLADAQAAIVQLAYDGKHLPALSSDGATLCLRLNPDDDAPDQIGFVPVGQGFDRAHATPLMADGIGAINKRLASGNFHDVAFRAVSDKDGHVELASLGIVVRFDVPSPTGRSVWVGMDQLELDAGPGKSLQLASVPNVKDLTGVAIVRAPKAAFLYLRVKNDWQVVPLVMP
jgi:hypothetical protein